MPRRSPKLSFNRKTIHSLISTTDRSAQLNMNACEQTQINVTSHLESIGNSIIDELKGSERDRLKQQLLMSCVPKTTTTFNNLPFASSRRSLKQVLDDLHTFDCHTQRQYRTIGSGDHDVNTNTPTTNVEKLDVIARPSKNSNMSNDESPLSTAARRKTKQRGLLDSSQAIDTETKKTPVSITRTICTRSSKLNTLNNNQEQLNQVFLNRARKRRSSLINNDIKQTEITNVDHTNLHKTMGEDVSGVKVSRRKLQSSVPPSTSIDCPKTTNDF